ncbi:hypothetical protein ACQP1G_20230 [Nocardia sp. CA-107356]|uniref:WXG100-like domain-containing protein n=1 Tax=Nocardia sp. CA-107356 TaxID=3239972 RepID=UPI003D8FAF60
MTLRIPPEIPGPLVALAAGRFPDLDEDALRRRATVLREAARRCEVLAQRHAAAADGTEEIISGYTAQGLLGAGNVNTTNLQAMEHQLDSLAQQCETAADSVERTKKVIIVTLVLLAAQLAWDALSFFAGGAAEAPVQRVAAEAAIETAAEEGAAVLAADGVAATAARAALPAIVKTAGIGAAWGAGPQVAADVWMLADHHGDGISWTDAGEAALAGMAGGVAGGVVGEQIANRLGPRAAGVGSNGLRVFARLGVGVAGIVGGGVAGGLVGGATGQITDNIIAAANGEGFDLWRGVTGKTLLADAVSGAAGGLLGGAWHALENARTNTNQPVTTTTQHPGEAPAPIPKTHATPPQTPPATIEAPQIVRLPATVGRPPVGDPTPGTIEQSPTGTDVSADPPGYLHEAVVRDSQPMNWGDPVREQGSNAVVPAVDDGNHPSADSGQAQHQSSADRHELKNGAPAKHTTDEHQGERTSDQLARKGVRAVRLVKAEPDLALQATDYQSPVGAQKVDPNDIPTTVERKDIPVTQASTDAPAHSDEPEPNENHGEAKISWHSDVQDAPQAEQTNPPRMETDPRTEDVARHHTEENEAAARHHADEEEPRARRHEEASTWHHAEEEAAWPHSEEEPRHYVDDGEAARRDTEKNTARMVAGDEEGTLRVGGEWSDREWLPRTSTLIEYSKDEFIDLWECYLGRNMTPTEVRTLENGCIGVPSLALGNNEGNPQLNLAVSDPDTHRRIVEMEKTLGPVDQISQHLSEAMKKVMQANKELAKARIGPGATEHSPGVRNAQQELNFRVTVMKSVDAEMKRMLSNLPESYATLSEAREKMKLEHGLRSTQLVMRYKEKFDSVLARKPPTREEFMRMVQDDPGLARLKGVDQFLPGGYPSEWDVIVFAKHFYSGQEYLRDHHGNILRDREGRPVGEWTDPNPEKFASDPDTGQVDMAGDLGLGKAVGFGNFDYGLYVENVDGWLSGNHVEYHPGVRENDPFKVFLQPSKLFHRYGPAYDSAVIALAFRRRVQ